MNQQFAAAPTIDSPKPYPKHLLFDRTPHDFRVRAKVAMLTPAEKDVYYALTGYLRNQKKRITWWTLPVSIEQLVEETGHTRETVSRAINRLIQLHFIIAKDHELRYKRIYYIYAWNPRQPNVDDARPQRKSQTPYAEEPATETGESPTPEETVAAEEPITEEVDEPMPEETVAAEEPITEEVDEPMPEETVADEDDAPISEEPVTTDPSSPPEASEVHSPACDEPVTGVCSSHHSDVTISSQNSESQQGAKLGIIKASAIPQTVRLDSGLDNNIDTLSHPVTGPAPDGAEASDREEKRERDDLVDLFYKAINKPIPKSRRKRKVANGELEALITDIASDERVECVDHAREILIDAFSRVKRKVYPIWDARVMETGYGTDAIEAAIHAFALRDSSTDEPEDSQPRQEGTEPSTEAFDEDDDTPDTKRNQTDAVSSKSDNIATIQWVLTASNYRDVDHAVFIVQRRRPEFTREEVLEAIGTRGGDQTNQEDKMVSQGPRGSLERPASRGQALSKHATVDGKATGWDAGCADVFRAIVTQDGDALAQCVGTG